MKKKRMRIHKQTLHLLNEPEYIYIWVNPEDMTLAICACEGSNKDALKVSKKRDCEFYSANLFLELRNMNEKLQDDCTYRLEGIVSQGKKVARFNILEGIV